MLPNRYVNAAGRKFTILRVICLEINIKVTKRKNSNGTFVITVTSGQQLFWLRISQEFLLSTFQVWHRLAVGISTSHVVMMMLKCQNVASAFICIQNIFFSINNNKKTHWNKSKLHHSVFVSYFLIYIFFLKKRNFFVFNITLNCRKIII